MLGIIITNSSHKISNNDVKRLASVKEEGVKCQVCTNPTASIATSRHPWHCQQSNQAPRLPSFLSMFLSSSLTIRQYTSHVMTHETESIHFSWKISKNFSVILSGTYYYIDSRGKNLSNGNMNNCCCTLPTNFLLILLLFSFHHYHLLLCLLLCLACGLLLCLLLLLCLFLLLFLLLSAFFTSFFFASFDFFFVAFFFALFCFFIFLFAFFIVSF